MYQTSRNSERDLRVGRDPQFRKQHKKKKKKTLQDALGNGWEFIQEVDNGESHSAADLIWTQTPPASAEDSIHFHLLFGLSGVHRMLTIIQRRSEEDHDL